MDDIDLAQQQERLLLSLALRRREAERAPSLPVTGYCYWCEEDTPGRLFCSDECREDWHQHIKRVRIERG